MAVPFQRGDDLALLLDMRSRPSDVLLGEREILFQKDFVHIITIIKGKQGGG